jgi:DNA helicase-2/ATP-dependent DNA helicase PcrA
VNFTEEYQKKFEQFLVDGLTAPQREAVTHRAGVILVRSCAGSGKTRVITARITHQLLIEQVPSASVLALTFTNKAAHEMKTRIMQSLPPEWPRPTVGTFHSFCLQFLKHHNTEPFTIMDTDDKEQCLKGIIKRAGNVKKITPQQISGVISRYKNDIQSLAQLAQAIPGDPVYQQLYHAYEHEKKASRCLDFDDLLLETLRLFKTNRALQERFQQRTKHILVDEYQDTNRLQHALIQAMSFSEDQKFILDSLCVVGDEDQSIYAWRGATIANILKFPTQFPEVKTITLEKNYRSVQQILHLADNIIQQNTQRVPKTIWSDRLGHDRVRILSCASSFQEGDVVVGAARALQREKSLSQLAILYRSHFQSRTLEEALIRHSIPYKIIGGTQFYDRQEIKDLLAYIRLIVNPFDQISFKRCINTPARSLGDAFVEMFMHIWTENGTWSCIDVAQHILEKKLLTATKHHALSSFLQILRATNSTESISACLERIITTTQFLAYLTNAYEQKEAQERIANVHELLNAARARELQGTLNPAQFLEEVTLLQDQLAYKSEEIDYVRLMTLHSAKGLEFDVVIIPGVEEGILPSGHAWSSENIEEERRLLYVGITRARERLIMTHSATRYLFGRISDQIPSRFLDKLPSSHAPIFEIGTWSSTQIITDSERWTGSKPPSSLHTTTFRTQQHTVPNRTTPKLPSRTSDITQPDQMRSISSRAASQEKHLQESGLGCTSTSSAWKINQTVSHPEFGTGKIVCIESKGATVPKLTIQFTNTLKKISASFVQPQ